MKKINFSRKFSFQNSILSSSPIFSIFNFFPSYVKKIIFKLIFFIHFVTFYISQPLLSEQWFILLFFQKKNMQAKQLNVQFRLLLVCSLQLVMNPFGITATTSRHYLYWSKNTDTFKWLMKYFALPTLPTKPTEPLISS